MEPAHQAQCPNCGGPIAFMLGSSGALVCPHCRYSVVRTDRDLSAIGKVADLVPTSPMMNVGDQGTIRGQGFRVAGRLQLDHGKGPWDEWYLGFDDGSWGWLAYAQGRFYLTKPASVPASVPASAPAGQGLPPYEHMGPGQSGVLPGGGPSPWTVSERGESVVVSAEGELPHRVVPGERGRYVDLSGPEGAFGTLDYGDGSEAPKLFTGAELRQDQIAFQQGGAGVYRQRGTVASKKLECSACGGPIELVDPESAERVACSYCYALLDFDHGALSLFKQLEKPRALPLIPLGTEGTLKGEPVRVIGYMERYTISYGETYQWREYLLYSKAGGEGGHYRWLLEDSGHWLYIRPASGGDVSAAGSTVHYKGQSYKHFSSARTHVRSVVGEFYWKVSNGDQAIAKDYIAPPHILSSEATRDEVTWSAGEYIDPKELWEGLGLKSHPPMRSGVGSAQPNPHDVRVPAITAAVFLVLLGLLGIIDLSRDSRVLVDGPVQVPATPTSPNIAQPPPTVDPASYTPVFTVNEESVLKFDLSSTVDNANLVVSCALINEDTQTVHEFTLEAENYHGVDIDGYSWSEGERESSYSIDHVPAGRYVLRLDPEWSHWEDPMRISTAPWGVITGQAQPPLTPPTARVKVHQGSDGGSALCCCCAFFLMLLPLIWVYIRRTSFERQRWENSGHDLGQASF